VASCLRHRKRGTARRHIARSTAHMTRTAAQTKQRQRCIKRSHQSAPPAPDAQRTHTAQGGGTRATCGGGGSGGASDCEEEKLGER
jgi:hypothetical protein